MQGSLQRRISRRRGIVIPIVIGILTVFFILLIAMSQGSTEVRRNTSLINHRTHSRFLALGVIEEMHDILWNKLSNPQKRTNARNDVISAVIGGGEFEMDLHSELKYAHKLYTGQDKGKKESKKAKIQVIEAVAKFHGFKLIRYSAGDIYRNNVAFYKSPDGGAGGVPSSGEAGTHPDWFGFVTYTVKAQHGIVSKTMQQSRPVKIVDMTPLGREYAVFEMEPSQGQKLNDGPGFYIDGRDNGRIRLIGPYYLDVEGEPSGLSGGGAFSFGPNDSVGGLSYPSFAGDVWTDDAFIPSPKWNTACPWFTYDPGPRLSMGTGGSVGFFPCIPMICCPSPLSLPLDYVGMFLQPQSQEWISAVIEKDEQNFSMMGIPGDPEFGNKGFKGLLYAEGGGYEEAQGLTEDWDPDPGMEIRHEGVIIGNYMTHSVKSLRFPFTTPGYPCGTFYWCAFGWMHSEGEQIQNYFAFKGDEEPEVDWMATIIGGLMDIVGGYTMGSAMGAASGTMSAIGAVAKGIGQSLMTNAMNIMNAPGLETAGLPMAEQMPNVFPSGFRMLHRSAARHYANMDEALWKKKNLLLDGTYWVDDMNTKVDVKYIGKGTLAAFGGDFSSTTKVKQFEPNDIRDDWLNIWYMHVGQDGALQVDADFIQAGVFSRGGINPEKSLFIEGNLMVSNIGKDQMTADLAVAYWNEKLHDIEDDEFKKDYRILSLSPKVEAISEVTLKLKTGLGDDGIEVIVPSIGE